MQDKYCNTTFRGQRVSSFVLNPAIFAMLIILIHDALTLLTTYYVDLLAIPFGMEIIRIVTREEKEISKEDIIYCAFLGGLMLGFKLTNIIYLIPCFILFLIKIWKKLSVTMCIKFLLAGSIPSSIYLIYNYICTGNPVFPYYQKIFRSEYFDKGWYDGRWGGESLIEKILWIFHAVIVPEERLSEAPFVYNSYYIICLFSVVVLTISVIVYIMRKKEIHGYLGRLLIIFWGSAILWGLTTGYSRYFVLGWMLLGILFYYVLIYLSNWKYLSILSALSIVLWLIPIGEGKIWFEGRGWKWAKVEYHSWIENAKKCFNDFEFTDEEYDHNIDMLYLSNQLSSGYAAWLCPDIYTVNSTYFRYMSEEGNKYQEVVRKINDVFENGKVYDFRLRNLSDIESYIEWLNNNGLVLVSADTVSGVEKMLMNHIEKSEKKNCYTILEEETVVDWVYNEVGREISFLSGRMSAEINYILNVELIYEGEKIHLFRNEMEGGIVNVYIPPQIELIPGEKYQIVVSAEETDGTIIDLDSVDPIVIINYE